jgi:4-hydroxythreonine-4-phosphate dehydrogenase
MAEQPSYRLALTTGEPAGIGPDLLVAIAQTDWPVELVVVGDPDLLVTRARQLGLPLQTVVFDPKCKPCPHRAGRLPVLPVALAAPVRCGVLNVDNARYVLAVLEQAIAGCKSGLFAAMVTAPLQKSIINDAGIAFTGHTEFLAEQTGAALPVMLLTAPGLRVALVTTHLRLADVPAAITEGRVLQVLNILLTELRTRFGIPQPRVAVCGLNPHAGEQGHLGREELERIIPALDQVRAQGHDVVGPLPADTAFLPRHLEGIDAVLAMYHDQGLPVLKHHGFGNAVNITLGLPIIRTSVDHGTALDLAGSGRADMGSFRAAIEAAMQMASFVATSR